MPSTWNGGIWIGTGNAYFIGGAGDSTPHAHHLIQIVVGLHGDVAIEDASGRVHLAPGFVIPSGMPHRVISSEASGRGESLMIFVESFSVIGKWLSSRSEGQGLTLDHIDAERANSIRRLLRQNRSSEQALVDDVVSTIAEGAWRTRPMDRRIALAIDHIEQNCNDAEIFERIADTLGISLRYLRKIFERETGMTMQRFRLWSKMKKSIDHALTGGTLTNASALAGFSDSAHFSRTFRDMFGVSPSQIFDKLPKPHGRRFDAAGNGGNSGFADITPSARGNRAA